MPRIRTIKPEFWLDEDLAELPAETRLLAIGLLNHADDEGYFKANPMIVRAAIFPFTDNSLNIPGMLNELSEIGYLRIGTGADGKEYGQVTNFLEHQRVNKPSPSKIKGLEPFIEDSVNPKGKDMEDSPPEGKGKEQGKEGRGREKLSGVPRELIAEWFETLWKKFDTGFGQKGSKKNALAQFKKLNPDKQLFDHMVSALDAQIADKSALKDLGLFWERFKHVERWLRDRRWEDELSDSASLGNTGKQSAVDRQRELADQRQRARESNSGESGAGDGPVVATYG